MEQKGIWLNIVDYAAYRNISLSTIRRYIKANRVKYQLNQGKYLIFVSDENLNKKELESEKEVLELKLEIQRLKMALRDVSEELADTKTLLLMYESQQCLPQIPQDNERV